MTGYERNVTNDESAIVFSDRELYTASSFARSSPLHLQVIGSLQAKKAHASNRSGLHSFLFLLLPEDHGVLYMRIRSTIKIKTVVYS